MSKVIYKICVSGAAKGDSVKLAYGLARAVGVQVVSQGHVLFTGATTGLPHAAAKAAKQAGGEAITSIGFSPASTWREHVNKYRLPDDAFDIVFYTGFDYMGRDLLMVRSCDAMIMIGGRIGTLHELTVALEEHKPIGVLVGSGGMTEEVQHVLKAAKRARTGLIFEEDPATLVDKIIKAIEQKYYKLHGKS